MSTKVYRSEEVRLDPDFSVLGLVMVGLVSQDNARS
jgi:hypothetical protein